MKQGKVWSETRQTEATRNFHRNKGGPTATSNLHFRSSASKITRVVIYQVLKKSLPSLLPEEEPDKTPPKHRPQPKPAGADVHCAALGETASEFTRKASE